MTQMGLNYLVYQESVRANQANERLKHDQNVETARHNVQTESVALGELAVKRGTLDETIRSNLRRESETVRSNVAREMETHRSNIAQESISLASLSEAHRANIARETENKRSNVAKEKETHRSNLAHEKEQKRANTLDALTPSMASYLAFTTGVEQTPGNIATFGASTGLDTLTGIIKNFKQK